MEVKVQVDFGDIGEKLQQLAPKLARRALRKGVVAVGDMWIAEMKAKVPVGTGDLRESISKKVSTKARGKASSAKVSVGPAMDTAEHKGDTSQDPAVYAMFVEFGTKRSRPSPFMRPVFDATADKAVEVFADVLKGELDGIVKG